MFKAFHDKVPFDGAWIVSDTRWGDLGEIAILGGSALLKGWFEVDDDILPPLPNDEPFMGVHREGGGGQWHCFPFLHLIC